MDPNLPPRSHKRRARRFKIMAVNQWCLLPLWGGFSSRSCIEKRNQSLLVKWVSLWKSFFIDKCACLAILMTSSCCLANTYLVITGHIPPASLDLCWISDYVLKPVVWKCDLRFMLKIWLRSETWSLKMWPEFHIIWTWNLVTLWNPGFDNATRKGYIKHVLYAMDNWLVVDQQQTLLPLYPEVSNQTPKPLPILWGTSVFDCTITCGEWSAWCL